jgi:hypothetical protein
VGGIKEGRGKRVRDKGRKRKKGPQRQERNRGEEKRGLEAKSQPGDPSTYGREGGGSWGGW